MAGTLGSSRTDTGTCSGGPVRVAPGVDMVVDVVVIVCDSSCFLGPLRPYNAAVVAAPTAADAPATMARVNLDMSLAGGGIRD